MSQTGKHAFAGRCVGCYHDFDKGDCPGCGAVPARDGVLPRRRRPPEGVTVVPEPPPFGVEITSGPADHMIIKEET